MSTYKGTLIVGLTGSFGSGCTTLCKSLEKMGFKSFSLSNIVKKIWEEQNPGKTVDKDAKRSELQDVGNEIRRTKGYSYLAETAISDAVEKTSGEIPLVFDSIRHTDEVEQFRNTFADFFLIAVDCPVRDRWERVKQSYYRLGLTEEHFQEDDTRDKNEAGVPYGQQVEACVDEADILIDNEKKFDRIIVVEKLRGKIQPYIDLISGKVLRNPRTLESYMSMAYTASLMSQCIKRQVGAVIIDERYNAVLGVGYNENPEPRQPCIDEYTDCYKDIYKDRYFEKLKTAGLQCPNPKCQKSLKDLKFPYRCECGWDLDKYFIPDRALSQCTALHAEERAIMSSGGRDLEGSTLYSTTFPCSRCANKIIRSKIGRIVYATPYPDGYAVEALIDAKIPTYRFEGVKARAYFRLFGHWRKKKEDEIWKRKSSS